MGTRIVPGERYEVKGHPNGFYIETSGVFLGEYDERAYFKLDNENFAIAEPSSDIIRVGDAVKMRDDSLGVLRQVGKVLFKDKRNIEFLLKKLEEQKGVMTQ